MQPDTQSKRMLLRIAAACVVAAGVVATTSAGIQGSGFRNFAAVGVVTSVDDVTVNGTTYGSAHAHISINGKGGDKSQLHVGQVVEIEGSVDAKGAIADQIWYAAEVRGVVTAANPGTRSFSVLGQTVRMTDDTVIDADSSTSAAIAAGAIVEVSGFPNAAGDIVASRVAVLQQSDSAQVRGVVAALDQGAKTFLIDTLLVDYDGARVDGHLQNGAIVLVQGDAAGGALLAQGVAVAAPLGSAGEKGDLEGLITSFASAAEFELNGQRVVGDEKTHYVLHGVALGPDVGVDVSGQFDERGVLVADKVQVKKKK
jgi:hypothetical protein